MLEPAGNSLFGFGGKKIDKGKKAIPVSFEEGERVCTRTITLDVVNLDYPYTAIFGRGFTNRFEVVIKQSYLCTKMPSPFEVITVHGDQLASWQIEGKPIPRYSPINKVTNKKQELEQTTKRPWHREQKQQKTPKRRHCPSPRLISENNDVFAWSANDLQGVS